MCVTRALKLRILGAACAAALFLCPDARSQETGAGNAVKAAFLFNFTKFIQWPKDKFSSEATPLQVGFFGFGAVRDFFEEANQQRTAGNRKIITCNVLSSADVRNCHILFVNPQNADGLSSLLAEARKNHVLTVGHCNGFINSGGMINFVDSAHGIRFQVNARAARRAGIKMSSRLLLVAQVVDEGGNVIVPDARLFR